MAVLNISVITLAGNEELHIQRCIENVSSWVRDVFVVDCFSTDKTVEIAGSLGAHVFQNVWEGQYSRQFNWALENLPIKTRWVLRLDADEYLCPGLIEEIKVKLETLPEDVTGVAFHLRRVFMGRVIRHGMPRIKMIRLFRYGKARCEQRLMDEHIELLEGRAVEFEGEFADHNLNDIGWWTAKHNGYALREAVDLLDLEYGLLEGSNAVDAAGSRVQTRLTPLCQKNSEAAVGRGRGQGELQLAVGSQQWARNGRRGTGLEAQAAEKRRKKMRYAKMPLFWRAFVYFCWRYFLRGGFLEGKEGFLWHFLQGWWYRTLVDAKVWEIKRESGGDRDKMLALLRGKYGMKV